VPTDALDKEVSHDLTMAAAGLAGGIGRISSLAGFDHTMGIMS